MHSDFKSLLSYVTPHRKVLLLAVFLMIGESAIALANPWLAGKVTGHLFSDPSLQGLGLVPFLGLWSLLLVMQSVLSFSNRYLLGSTGETMLARLRGRLYDHLQALPLAYFHQRRRGEVLALLGNDAAHISNFVTSTLVSLLPMLITFCGAFYFLFRIDAQIAALAGLLIPAFFLAAKLIGRRLRPLSSEWMQTHAEMFATLEENIGMLPAIKSFTRETHESARFQSRNLRLMRVAKRQLLIQSILQPAVQLLAGLGILLLLLVSALQLQDGDLQAADMVSLLLYSALLTRPVSGMAGVYGSIQTARGATQRLLDAFAVQPEPDDIGSAPLPALCGRIRFEDVHFAYPGRPKVLDGVDISIEAGETVALTGTNGSGKSTIVHLLMRFIDPDQGRIAMDGTNIREATIASLRGQIGLVAQNVLLLSGTIRRTFRRQDTDSSGFFRCR